MVQESNFTVRVAEELKIAFAEAARRRDRTAAQLMRDFMRSVVQETRENDEYEAWFRARVEGARREMRAGLGIPHEAVKARRVEQRRRLAENAKTP